MSDASLPRLAALDTLRDELSNASLPLDLNETQRAKANQSWAIQQIDDYIAPRLANLDAPLLAVAGGSTGAGKSTIVNAIVGSPVTRTGAIRPTTRQPILLHAPGEGEWFETDRILPGLSRIRGTATHQVLPSSQAGATPDASLIGSVVLVEDPHIPKHIALIDAPDIDSIADENRALASQLLAAADLWFFVTTANRYADAVPWQLLDDAATRDITVAVVLNRVPPGAEQEIQHDLQRMLHERGLPHAPVFTITEQPLDQLGMLPPAAVAGLRNWLGTIAADSASRHELARRTVLGSARKLTHMSHEIAIARDVQLRTAEDLMRIIDDEYEDAIDDVREATRDGQLLRGEVLARWQDVVGTSDAFRGIETWVSGARDRVTGWFTGKPKTVEQVEATLESGLHAVIVDAASRAAASSWQRVRATEHGRHVFSDATLAHESDSLNESAARLMRDWQAALVELVRTQAAGKRTKARVLSLGLNAVTVALMIVVFASTAGLTGGEVAIAGGSAVVGQKLLETLFGDEAVRKLATQARDDLELRVTSLFRAESLRYSAELMPVTAPGSGDKLRSAIAEFEATLRDDLAAPPASQLSPPTFGSQTTNGPRV
ncbi:dynamin family protein [Gulosibacter bifidus]|uniref:Dynamin family protein n=1 Tax=Gulosibacter bifidus TaxID=272239 RepID=A0ABW5RM29_9MICO|nr:dynamin family protein [Gulosibacter bifidus]